MINVVVDCTRQVGERAKLLEPKLQAQPVELFDLRIPQEALTAPRVNEAQKFVWRTMDAQLILEVRVHHLFHQACYRWLLRSDIRADMLHISTHISPELILLLLFHVCCSIHFCTFVHSLLFSIHKISFLLKFMSSLYITDRHRRPVLMIHKTEFLSIVLSFVHLYNLQFV